MPFAIFQLNSRRVPPATYFRHFSSDQFLRQRCPTKPSIDRLFVYSGASVMTTCPILVPEVFVVTINHFRPFQSNLRLCVCVLEPQQEKKGDATEC